MDRKKTTIDPSSGRGSEYKGNKEKPEREEQRKRRNKRSSREERGKMTTSFGRGGDTMKREYK